MASAPTTEIGAVQQGVAGTVLSGWSAFQTELEHAPNLAWPNNLAIYRQMKTDAQVAALYKGTTLPIRGYNWMVDPNGAREEVVRHVAEDLNLPVKGEDNSTRGRRKKRFSFPQHLKWALEAIMWGHYYFEQVGEVKDQKWRLRKLAPRPATIIEDIMSASDGGLQGIKVPSARSNVGMEFISVDRLVAYVWDMEPGRWAGTSMFREIYKNWLLKDKLIRVDLVKHDRAGGGTALATAPPGATPQQIEALARMAQQVKVDEEGGGAIPHGARLDFMGVTGSVPDTWNSIRGHNEEMARAWMAQVIQLGQTQTGSRALGETFSDSFGAFQRTVAGWFCDVFNEHVIEDLVDWNYGEEEPAPLITYEVPEDGSLAVADLATMVDKGLIEVDEELETWLRQNYKMPEKGTPRSIPAPEPSPQGTTEPVQAKKKRGVPVRAAEDLPSPSLPDRDLRRQPYEHEIVAAVDFAELDKQHTASTTSLFDALKKIQDKQIDALADGISSADDDLTKLSALSVDPDGADTIKAAMLDAAEKGADTAKAEAIAQGRTSTKPAEIAADMLEARAVALSELMARDVASAASREALRRTGTGTSAEVATKVSEYLKGLARASLEKMARGAISTGTNEGRSQFMVKNDPARVYASELLDENTCEFCTAIDGTEFESVDEARSWYPAGFVDCAGGDNCRGTMVAVYDETAPTLER